MEIIGTGELGTSGARLLAAVVGGGTVLGLVHLAAPLFEPAGSDPFTAVVAVLAVVQLSAGVLLLVGAGRLSAGAGRRVLFAGGGLEFLVCAAYGWYAVDAVAGDPQDGGLFVVFLGVPCGVALMTASSLILATRLPATATCQSRLLGDPRRTAGDER
jgi:hypothetical protein